MINEEKQIEHQLRQIALNEAVKAHNNGVTLQANEIVNRAKTYYEFLKGEQNG